jgi:hypothetical protein
MYRTRHPTPNRTRSHTSGSGLAATRSRVSATVRPDNSSANRVAGCSCHTIYRPRALTDRVRGRVNDERSKKRPEKNVSRKARGLRTQMSAWPETYQGCLVGTPKRSARRVAAVARQPGGAPAGARREPSKSSIELQFRRQRRLSPPNKAPATHRVVNKREAQGNHQEKQDQAPSSFEHIHTVLAQEGAPSV